MSLFSPTQILAPLNCCLVRRAFSACRARVALGLSAITLTLSAACTGPAQAQHEVAVEVASPSQAPVAFEVFTQARHHMRASLGLRSDPASIFLFAEDALGRCRWGNIGAKDFHLSAGVAGKGALLHANQGWDLLRTGNRIAGVLVGLEQGFYAPDGEATVAKTGVSLGAYVGQDLGRGLSFTALATATAFHNTTNHEDQTAATSLSTRMMAAVRLDGIVELGEGRGTLVPVANASFTSERLHGLASSAQQGREITFGEARLGLQYWSTFENDQQYFLKGEVHHIHGDGDVTLTNRETLYRAPATYNQLEVGYRTANAVRQAQVSLVGYNLEDAARRDVRVNFNWTLNL